MGWNDEERGKLPPPIPKDADTKVDLLCPSCGTKSYFEVDHLLQEPELLYCHNCCKAYKNELWRNGNGHSR